jgi:hypothetical protein
MKMTFKISTFKLKPTHTHTHIDIDSHLLSDLKYKTEFIKYMRVYKYFDEKRMHVEIN